MSISLIQTRSGGNGGGSSQSTAALATTTSGNTLFVVVSYNSATAKILKLSDGLNSFGRLSKTTDASNCTTEVFWSTDITGSTTPVVTVIFDVSVYDISITAREYASTRPLVLDKRATGAVTAQNPTSPTTGVTTVANELVIGIFGGIGDQTKTAGTGYGNLTLGTTQSGSPFAILEDKTVSSTGTQAATFNTSAAGNGVVGVYTFYENTNTRTIKDMVSYIDVLTQDYANTGTFTTTYQELQFQDTVRDYRHKFYWDPAQYDGVTEVYFEGMIGVNTSAGTVNLKLYNSTDSVDIAGSEISQTDTYPTTAIRSGNIVASMPTTPKQLTVWYKNSNSTMHSDVVTGRLVIRQQNATKFEQSPIFDQANTVSNTSTPTYDIGSSVWLYEAAKFDGLQSVRWELAWASSRGTGNTGFMDFWDITTGTALDTFPTSNNGATYLSQDLLPFLVDGHEYGVRFTSSGTASTSTSTTIGGARLRIAQVLPTKSQFQFQGLIAGLFADTDNDGFFIDPAWFGSYNPHMFAEISYNNLSSTATGYGSARTLNSGGTEHPNARINTVAGDANGHRSRNSVEMAWPTTQTWYRPYSVTTSAPGAIIAQWRTLTNMAVPPAYNLVHSTSTYLGPRRPTKVHTTDTNLYSGANFKTDYFAFTFSTPSFSRTHTTDTNKRKASISLTHSTDTLKRKQFTRTHTTDTLKRAQTTRTHLTDTLKRKITVRAHTTDTFKRLSVLKTHTTDINKRIAGVLKSHLTDTLKRKQNTLSHSTDLNKLKSGNVKTHTTDVNKQKSGVTRTHSTDVLKRVSSVKVHSTDTLKRVSLIKTHSTDTFKRAGLVKSHTTDVLKRAAVLKSHTTDTNKRKLNTKSHTTDVNKRLANVKIHSTDLNKRKGGVLRTHLTDTLKRATATKVHSTDVLKRTLNTKSHTTDVYKRGSFTKQHTTDFIKRLSSVKTHSTDTLKRSSVSKIHLTDVLKRKAFTKVHSTDTLKRKATIKTHLTDVLKRKQVTKTHLTDTLKRKTNTKTHLTDALKRKAFLKTHSTDAIKRKRTTRSHTTDVSMVTAARYWVGGSGSWGDTSHWSYTSGGSAGASVPNRYNDVYFDDNLSDYDDFTSTVVDFTAYTEVEVKSINATGLTHRQATFDSTVGSGVLIKSYGDFITQNRILLTYTALDLLADDGLTHYIDTAYTVTNGVTIEAGAGTTYSLVQTIASNNADGVDDIVFAVKSGTLLANGFDIVSGNFEIDNGATVDMGGGTIHVYEHSFVLGATGVLSNVGTYNFLFSASAPAVSTSSHTIESNGQTLTAGYINIGYNNDRLPTYINGDMSATYSMQINAGNYVIAPGATLTGPTFILSGYDDGAGTAYATLRSQVPGSQYYLVKTDEELVGDWIDVEDSNVSGGIWHKPLNYIDAGNNTGWVAFYQIAHSTDTLLRYEAGAPYITLVDNFNTGTTLDYTKWAEYPVYDPAGASPIESGKVKVMPNQYYDGTNLGSQALQSLDYYSIIDSQISWQVPSHYNDPTSIGITWAFTFIAPDNNQPLYINFLPTEIVDNVSAFFFDPIGGGTTQTGTIDFASQTYFRIRAVGTTAYFETSADGLNWTEVFHDVVTYAPERTQARWFAGSSANDSTYYYVDNVNILPTPSAFHVHTTDTYLRSRDLIVHSTDVNKRAKFTLVHSTNVLKRSALTRTHSTDTNKRKATLHSHTTDVLKRKITLKTHLTDVNKRKATLKTHTTDVNKRKSGILKSHTTDVLKRKLTARAHSTDINKRLSNVIRAHTTDVLKRATSALTHTTDVNKRAVLVKTHTTDTILRSKVTKSHTTDVLKRKASTLVHSTDVNKRKSGIVRTHSTDVLTRVALYRTHKTDVNKKNAYVRTHSTDTVKRKANIPRQHTTDTFLRKRNIRLHSTDINKRRTTTVDHSTDVFKRSGQGIFHVTDINLRKITTTSHSTDVVKRAQVTKSHTTSVNKRRVTLRVHTTDFNKRKATVRVHSTDVNKRKSFVVLHSTDVLKRLLTTKSHTTSVNKRKSGIAKIYTTDTVKRKLNTVAHSTSINKTKAGISLVHTTDVNKRKASTVSHLTDVNKRKTNVVAHATNVNKRKANTVSHSTDANKRRAFAIVHSTDTFLRKRRNVSHTTSVSKKRVHFVYHSTDVLIKNGRILSHSTDTSLYTLRGTKKVLMGGVWHHGRANTLIDDEWVVAQVRWFDGTNWYLAYD